MATSKLTALIVTCVAALVCVHLAGAQKTIKNSWQQQQPEQQSSGSNPNSVYGGYEQSSSSSFNQQRAQSPVRQRGRTQQQTYVSQQRTEQRPVYQQQQQQESSSGSSSSSSYDQQAEADAEPASYGSVQGSPGQDFPAYTRVPKTSFSCDGLPYEYGMYADEETGCQAYHLCYNGRKDSFLCGPGTVFNQRILHCDYWYSVECNKSSQYYSSNAYMGSSQPEPGPAEANSAPARPQAQGSSSSYQSAASSTVNRPASPSKFRQQSASFNRNTQQVQEAY